MAATRTVIESLLEDEIDHGVIPLTGASRGVANVTASVAKLVVRDGRRPGARGAGRRP